MGIWTRRAFIGAGIFGGGTLLVGVALRPGHRAPQLAKYVTNQDETLLSAWVKIAPDNKITAIIPHSEMGQGIHTALGAMLAEEMDADWQHLELMEAPAIPAYANYILGREYILGQTIPPGFVQETVNGAFLKLSQKMDLQITGGSTSVRFTGTAAMQTAGAATRELLRKVAAKSWNVSEKTLRTQNSHIFHDPTGRQAPYADFAQAAAYYKPKLYPKLKNRKDYHLMGRALPRRDIPAKVNGTAQFSIDASVDGMKYATVKSAPVLGQKVQNFDATYAKTMPGVLDVLNMDDYVAVIADGYWQAKQALDTLNIQFTTSPDSQIQQADIFAQYTQDLNAAKSKTLHRKGHLNKAFENAHKIIKAEYRVPYLAHATMEPMNATAWMREGRCDIWAGTQNPLGVRNSIAKTFDIKAENVTVHNHVMGGGFGRRAIPDYCLQAVHISKKMQIPIKLIWSREEDITQDHYRPSAISRLKVALDAQGQPTGWDNLFVHKHDPVDASLIPYDIKHQHMHYVNSPTHIRFGPWRSVDHSQHGFFTESFIDELAHHANQDPYLYRRGLLKHKPRHLAVLDAAAKAANWSTPLSEGFGRGISIVESFMTIVAQVVTVDTRSGSPRVTHVHCAADAGFAVNPDGFRAQMESGIIFGLTAALYGKISIANGAIEQSNFHDYEMIRMDMAPDIDVIILESDASVGGAGEPGTPPIAPALANAIFQATGQRLRTLPVNDSIPNITT